ncbi:minor capsid protein [Rhodovulum sulfidophilum]|nr:minor capsid protein [Rhodovulum sulfidophilum]
MRSPAHDTALFLAAQGATGAFGGAEGWPVYVGREPLQPVDVVTCYDTGGEPGLLVDLRCPRVQIRVRSASYDAAWQRAAAIYKALVPPVVLAVPGAAILGWMPSSEIAFIGRDDEDRALFTLNFEILRDSAQPA